MSKKPKGALHAFLKAAADLPPALHLETTPSSAEFSALLSTAAAGNPCLGMPAGTPCAVYNGPNGSKITCTCDGHGNCLFPT